METEGYQFDLVDPVALTFMVVLFALVLLSFLHLYQMRTLVAKANKILENLEIQYPATLDDTWGMEDDDTGYGLNSNNRAYQSTFFTIMKYAAERHNARARENERAQLAIE